MSRTPIIKLVAYYATPEKVFVFVPNEAGRYMLTDRCVVEVPCRHCQAGIGEPCYRTRSAGVRVYSTGTHGIRRSDYKTKYAHGHSQRDPQRAKPRVRAADLHPNYDPRGPLDDDAEY